MYLSKRQIRRYNLRVSMFAIIIIIVLHHIVPFIVVIIIVRRLPSLDLHTKKKKKKIFKKNVCSIIVPYDEWRKSKSEFYSFFWVSERRTHNARPFRFQVIGVRAAGAQ